MEVVILTLVLFDEFAIYGYVCAILLLLRDAIFVTLEERWAV